MSDEEAHADKGEWVCEFCEQTWSNRFSAAACCDIISFDLGYD